MSKLAKQVMEAEIAELQRGISILQAAHFVALYENEADISLADALHVAIMTESVDRIDKATTKL